METVSWVFDYQTYIIKAFVFTGAKKKIEIGFSSLSLGMEEGIPLKEESDICGRGALLVCIIVKGKNGKKFLIVYFHLRLA